jgi:uncharacterized protein YuzB (UPF0349 family)
MIEVKFCENNFIHGTEELIERLEGDIDGLKVEVESCLGYCGECAAGPFALVDDELVTADSVDELYDLIKEAAE